MVIQVEEIYKSIAENVVNNVQDGWVEAFIDVKRAANDALALSGGYKTGSENFISFKFRNFDRRIIEDFHLLHSATTTESKGWNCAKFTLYPTGKISIDFEWDQDLADEVEANS